MKYDQKCDVMYNGKPCGEHANFKKIVPERKGIIAKKLGPYVYVCATCMARGVDRLEGDKYAYC